MTKASKVLLLVCGSGWLLTPDGSAQAQEASDIIVTARRVEERLQDVPISITVFTQEQVANRNLINVQDLATYTPSLSVVPTFGAENASLSLRGFIQDSGTAPTVGAYFADVPAGRAAALTTHAGEGAGPGYFFDIQNVQVLKGPQGTLFGRNTTGGAILFVPHKPENAFESYVEGSVGNYDMWRLQGALNVPLGDTVRLRLAGDRMHRDGYLRNLARTGPRDLNDTDYVALRASLVIDVTPDLENYTIGSYTHSQTNGSVMKMIACGSNAFGPTLACPQLARQTEAGFYTAASILPEQGTDLEQWQVVNTTTWRTGDHLAIKNIASYTELANINNSSIFGEDFRLGPNEIPIVGTIVFAAPGDKIAHQSTLTEELQFQGSSADNNLTWQAGGYMEISNPLGHAGARSANLVNCTDIATAQCADLLGQAAGRPIGRVETTRSRTWYRSYGLYAQATYSLSEQFKLTGGLRYTWDRQKSEVSRVARIFVPSQTDICVDSASTLPDCFFAASVSSSRPTWLIGLDYKPADDILFYAKYARGYRSGGVLPTAPRGNQVFAPEKLDSYEIGAKTSFHGTVSGNFNIAAFYNDFSNQQLRAGFRNNFTGSQITGIANAGTSRIYGVEIDSSISPLAGLNIDGSYAYLNSKITAVAPVIAADPANFTPSIQIPVGAPLFYAPKHKFSVTGRYTLPVPDDLGDVTIGATYTYTSSRLATYAYYNPAVVAGMGADYGSLGSFGILNLNLNWKEVAGKPIDFALFATNVTGKKYFTGIGGVGGAFGFESASVGEPRMYGARLRVRFGN